MNYSYIGSSYTTSTRTQIVAEPIKLDGNEVIVFLANGDMDVLDWVYDFYKPAYLNWASRKFPTVNPQDLLDSWHDVVIAFYEQVSSHKLITLSCELKTFLFTIGYRVLIKKHKKMQKLLPGDEEDERLLNELVYPYLEEDDPWADQKELLLKAVNELPAQSKQILMLRFIDGKSLKDISEIVNYSSLNALSVTISRSLKRLKESIQENLELKQHGGKRAGID